MSWMRFENLFFALFLLSYFPANFAFTPSPYSVWFLGANAGWAWPDMNTSMTVANGSSAPAPSNVDYYAVVGPKQAGELGSFLGYRFDTFNAYVPFFSVLARYEHSNYFKTTGNIDQYSLPAFQNYSYSFKLSTDIISLEAKANGYEFGNFSPYVSLGIGLAGNLFADYHEIAAEGIIPRTSPGFKNKNNNNTIFNIGLGLDYFVNQRCWFSLGYQYTDLGRTQSGRGTEAWSSDTLDLGTFTMQAVWLSLAYAING